MVEHILLVLQESCTLHCRYLQIVRLDGCEQVVLAELVEHLWSHDLGELLTEEMQRLPVHPLGTVGLRAPLQNGNQGVQGDALSNNIFTTYQTRAAINSVVTEALSPWRNNTCGKICSRKGYVHSVKSKDRCPTKQGCVLTRSTIILSLWFQLYSYSLF